MGIARNRILPGDRRSVEANKIADTLELRIVGLRNSLVKLGAEHNTFLARTQKEQAEIAAALSKAKEELARVNAVIAEARTKDIKARKAWDKEKTTLKTDLENKIRSAKLYADMQKAKADEAARHVRDLNERVLSANIKFASREQNVAAREKACSEREKKQEALTKIQIANAEKLSESETNYRARARVLELNEKTCAKIIAREQNLIDNEARLDKKAELIQETEKKHANDKVFIAREKARLNRIRHLRLSNK